jgi:DMSO reductase anchor subunit
MGKLPLALCGIGLITSMAQVYRLRSITPWDTNRTLLAFVISAMVLGGIVLAVLDIFENSTPRLEYLVTSAIGLAGALLLSASERNSTYRIVGRLRLCLIAFALFGVMGTIVSTYPVGRWWIVLIFLIALAEETIGRWLFYEHLHQRIL